MKYYTMKVWEGDGTFRLSRTVSEDNLSWETSLFEEDGCAIEVSPLWETPALALCEGRHTFPVTMKRAIFPATVDPTSTCSLDLAARRVLRAYRKQSIVIYVTGLTVALIAALNVCREYQISVTLMHYNRETGEYYPQEVY